MPDFYLMETVSENTGVPSWDKDRAAINDVIRRFNDWQTEHDFDRRQGKLVLAHADLCRRRLGECASDWHEEKLADIENRVREILE